MTMSHKPRRRIFTHMEDAPSAKSALEGADGLLVPTRILLEVGEPFDLWLRSIDEGRSLVVPCVVVGRRPGVGILARASAVVELEVARVARM